jgi:hypothetical protein
MARAKRTRKKKPLLVNLPFTNQELVHTARTQMGYAEMAWYRNAKSAVIASTLSPWQVANHFGASFLECNKVRVLLSSVDDFHPRNFIFPRQLRDFEGFIRDIPGRKTFIVKPDKARAGPRITGLPRMRFSLFVKRIQF